MLVTTSLATRVVQNLGVLEQEGRHEANRGGLNIRPKNVRGKTLVILHSGVDTGSAGGPLPSLICTRIFETDHEIVLIGRIFLIYREF
jgi:hypothetical protein